MDILVDKQVVVEINSGHHYKFKDGEGLLNLKSQFRERMLTKMGYSCLNIRVEDYTNSNFSMLEDIYRIVESTNSIRNQLPAKPPLPEPDSTAARGLP